MRGVATVTPLFKTKEDTMAKKAAPKYKVIYVEVRPHTYEKLEKLCKLYDLPKNQVVAMALAILEDQKNPIKILNR